MSQLDNYTKRVWEGDSETVEEAWHAYFDSPSDETFIQLAVALYSFRNNKLYARQLVDSCDTLIEIAESDLRVKSPLDQELYGQIAARADTLSTHLEWISRQHDLGGFKPEVVRGIALQLCNHGIYFATAGNNPERGHTLALLHLTATRIYMERYGTGGGELGIFHALEEAEKAAQNIADPNQRARVYRKLGLFYRKCGHTRKGIRFGLHAVVTSGATTNVRLKSIAALFGIDR